MLSRAWRWIAGIGAGVVALAAALVTFRWLRRGKVDAVAKDIAAEAERRAWTDAESAREEAERSARDRVALAAVKKERRRRADELAPGKLLSFHRAGPRPRGKRQGSED